MSEALYRQILSRCVRVGECLVWQGATTAKNGYGQITVDGKHLLTHRVVYEHVHGEIPAGLTIDHVWARGCRHRRCCEPSHLEAVTMRENVLRGFSVAAKNAAKTVCDKGHPLVPGNFVAHPAKRGLRNCLICHREHLRAYGRRVAALRLEVASICRDCGAAHTRIKGRDNRCNQCLRAYARASRDRLVAQKLDGGLCVYGGCSEPHAANRKFCTKHLEQSRERIREWKAARKAERPSRMAQEARL